MTYTVYVQLRNVDIIFEYKVQASQGMILVILVYKRCNTLGWVLQVQREQPKYPRQFKGYQKGSSRDLDPDDNWTKVMNFIHKEGISGVPHRF